MEHSLGDTIYAHKDEEDIFPTVFGKCFIIKINEDDDYPYTVSLDESGVTWYSGGTFAITRMVLTEKIRKEWKQSGKF